MDDAFVKIFIWIILPLAGLSIYFAFKAGATKTILGIIAGVIFAAFFVFADQSQIETLADSAGRLIQFVVDGLADLFTGDAEGAGTGVQP